MQFTSFGFSRIRMAELKMSLMHADILRYFIDFKESGKMKTIRVSGERYFWVSYGAVSKNLPNLRISKDRVYRIFRDLTKLEILKHWTVTTRFGRFSYFTTGNEYESLINYTKSSEKDEQMEYNPIANDSEIDKEVGKKTVVLPDKTPVGSGKKAVFNYNSNINNSNINKRINGRTESARKINYSAHTDVKQTFPELLPEKSKYDKHLELLRRILPIAGYNTKFPKNDGEAFTKELSRICQYIDELIDGSFFDKKTWNHGWLQRTRAQAIPATKSMERVEKVLLQSVEKFVLLRKDGYWPPNKNSLPKEFSTFLYSPRTQKSFFLEYYYNEPRTLAENSVSATKQKVPESVRETLQKFYNNYTYERKGYAWDESNFWFVINKLCKWYRMNAEILQKTNIAAGWNPHCCTLPDFVDRIIEFANSGGPLFWVHPGKGNHWDRLCDWLSDNYQVDLRKTTEADIKIAENEELQDYSDRLHADINREISKLYNTVLKEYDESVLEPGQLEKMAVGRAVIDWLKSYGLSYRKLVPKAILEKYGDLLDQEEKYYKEDKGIA